MACGESPIGVGREANALKRSVRDCAEELALCAVLGAQGSPHPMALSSTEP